MADVGHCGSRRGSLDELRDRLIENHTTWVWLLTFKKAHPDCLPFGEVVEELMCRGWVDSSVWPTRDGWSRSVKRAWLEKIKRTKTAPTRAKIVAASAAAARGNLKNGGLR